jgi:hypothetical protein
MFEACSGGAIRRLSLLGPSAVAICLLLACCYWALEVDYYNGRWAGYMVSPVGEDHPAFLDLVHKDDLLTGILEIEGVLDSVAVRGLEPDWWGFDLAAEADCAHLSGGVQFGELPNLAGSILVEWRGCDRQGVESWYMWLEREE